MGLSIIKLLGGDLAPSLGGTETFLNDLFLGNNFHFDTENF